MLPTPAQVYQQTKWRKKRRPQTEGHSGLCTLKRQRLDPLRILRCSEVCKPSSLNRLAQGRSFMPFILCVARRWSQGAGAPASSKEGQKISVSRMQMFEQSERVQPSPFVRGIEKLCPSKVNEFAKSANGLVDASDTDPSLPEG